MTESSRTVRIAAVPIMWVAGALVAVQSQANGRLAVELGHGARAGFAAACISFGSGLVLVLAIALSLPSGRAGIGAIIRARGQGLLRPGDMVGGAFGAFLIATQGLAVGTIGVALFSIAVTAGQSVNSLFMDHVGLGPSGRQPLSVPRVVGSAFAVVAVVLASGERVAATVGWQTVALAALALVAGAGTSVQQALNGRVSAVGGPWATTVNNFVVGTAGLLTCLAVSFLADGRLVGLPHQWWLYTGGALGVGFIWLAAALVKVHGVLVLGLSMVAGNVMGAELLELFSGHSRIGPVGVGAGALTVCGVLIAVLIRPSRASG